ncbi:MAG: hypothetical protein GXP55_21635 [Deltaproteobacteria bacterium]|nr:hypothetical protein [Deltaproteobacteria bacterium]
MDLVRVSEQWEEIQIGCASVRVQRRPGYLYLIESGHLSNRQELMAYFDAMDALVRRTDCSRALVDTRDESQAPAAHELRQDLWKWHASKRGFEAMAVLLSDPMIVVRINMTALSHGARLKAFTQAADAQRWLRSVRPSTIFTGPSRED